MSLGAIAAGAVISGGGGGGYPAEVLADPVSGYWKHAEATGGLIDSSSHSKGGTVSGTPTRGVASITPSDSGTCWNYGGVTWVDTPAMNGTGEAGSVFSCHVVIQPASIGADQIIHSMASETGGSTARFKFWVTAAGKLEVKLWLTGGQYVITGATTLVAGDSHHVGFTYNGTVGKVFLDGLPDGSVSVTDTAWTPSVGGLVGAGYNGAIYAKFSGKIQHLAFLGSTALSDARMLALATAAGLTPSKTWDFRGLSGLPAGWARRGIAAESFDAAGLTATYSSGQCHYYTLPAIVATGVFEVKMLVGPSSAMIGPAVMWTHTSQGALIGWYTGPNGALLLGVGGSFTYDGNFANDGGSAGTYPVWFRLRFVAGTNTVYGSYSTDGVTFSSEVSIPRTGMGGVGELAFGSILSPGTATFVTASWTTP